MKPLEIEILKQLNENGRLRFNEILKRIEQQEIAKNISNIASVKLANALNALRLENLVIREYEERKSFYEITDKGSRALTKSRAATEVSSEKLSEFANCEVVLSSNGETDASVYLNGPIDAFTRDQIGNILARHPGIKILGHAKKE